MVSYRPLPHCQRFSQPVRLTPRLAFNQQHELRVDTSLRHIQGELGLVPHVVQIPDPRVDSSVFRLDYQIEHDTLKPVPPLSLASFDDKLMSVESSLSSLKSQYDEFKSSNSSVDSTVSNE